MGRSERAGAVLGDDDLQFGSADRPGLGIELNEEVIRAHLIPGERYFAPTDEWNRERSNDRLWS